MLRISHEGFGTPGDGRIPNDAVVPWPAVPGIPPPKGLWPTDATPAATESRLASSGTFWNPATPQHRTPTTRWEGNAETAAKNAAYAARNLGEAMGMAQNNAAQQGVPQNFAPWQPPPPSAGGLGIENEANATTDDYMKYVFQDFPHAYEQNCPYNMYAKEWSEKRWWV